MASSIAEIIMAVVGGGALTTILTEGRRWLAERRADRTQDQTLKQKSEAEKSRLRRQERSDEIELLYQAIEDARAERDAWQKELADLRSEHQDCLIKQTELKVRVEILEGEVKRLNTLHPAREHEDDPAG